MEIIWTKTAIGQFEKAVRYTRKQFGDRVAEQFMQQVVEAVHFFHTDQNPKKLIF